MKINTASIYSLSFLTASSLFPFEKMDFKVVFPY